jgi:hypothetical protein
MGRPRTHRSQCKSAAEQDGDRLRAEDARAVKGSVGPHMIVIIGGMIRSGSTFAFNIARELLLQSGTVATYSGDSYAHAVSQCSPADHFVLKTHWPDADTQALMVRGQARAICTHRKPEDAIASWMQAFEFSLESSIDSMRRWLEWHSRIADRVDNISYSKIDEHADKAIAKVHQLIHGQVLMPLAREQREKYDKARLREWLDPLPKDEKTFDMGVSYYDRETFFHRRHIAASPATLTDAERERVRQALRPFLTEDGELAYLSSEE